MTMQDQAKELLPFVQAMADGEEVQVYCDEKWITKSTPDFIHGLKYRIAPETIIVNGFEIEAPLKEAPEIDDIVHIADPSNDFLYDYFNWNGSAFCCNILSRGLCHKTRDAAIAHAKAMIGVDPNE